MNAGPSSHTSIVHSKCPFTVNQDWGYLNHRRLSYIFVDNRNIRLCFNHCYTYILKYTHKNNQEPYLQKKKTWIDAPKPLMALVVVVVVFFLFSSVTHLLQDFGCLSLIGASKLSLTCS